MIININFVFGLYGTTARKTNNFQKILLDSSKNNVMFSILIVLQIKDNESFIR
jgi:hypothetical protein